MSRRFTEARALLGDLLDRHENGAASPIGYPDYAGFADVVAMDRFIGELRDAERHGAVRLAMGQGRTGGEIAHVRLESSARLYALLGRRPVGELADQASGRLLDGLDLPDVFEPALVSLRKAWAQGKAWQGFALDDVDRLRPALIMAQAILEGRHRGVDYRTFSRRTAGDSKALERSRRRQASEFDPGVSARGPSKGCTPHAGPGEIRAADVAVRSDRLRCGRTVGGGAALFRHPAGGGRSCDISPPAALLSHH